MALDDELTELENDNGLNLNNDSNKIIVQHLFDEKLIKDNKIELKSDLNEFEISQLSKLLFVGKKMKLNGVTEICHTFMRLRVSKERKGRMELIEAIKSTLESVKSDAFANTLKGVLGK
jgi:hypothetical protein